jgi:anti-sigma regulatory factor (Ser/Thr protein kinase)
MTAGGGQLRGVDYDPRPAEAGPHVVELAIPASTDYLALARAVIVAAARTWPGLVDERLEDLQLAASEACANAIRAHALAGSDASVRIRCALDDDRVEVEVFDEGRGFDLDGLTVLPPVTDPARLERESGLGIPLIRSYSDHSEIRSSPSGTLVRMVLYAPSHVAS